MKMNDFVEVSRKRVWSGNVKDLLGLFCIFRTNNKIVSGWVQHFAPDTSEPLTLYDKNDFRIGKIIPECLNMNAKCDIYDLKCGITNFTPPTTKLPIDITYRRQDVLVYEANHYEFKDINIDLDRVYPFIKDGSLCFIRFSDVNKEKIFIKEAIGDVDKEYTAEEFYNTFEDVPESVHMCYGCPLAQPLFFENEEEADET
jgi:hypothetical protein